MTRHLLWSLCIMLLCSHAVVGYRTILQKSFSGPVGSATSGKGSAATTMPLRQRQPSVQLSMVQVPVRQTEVEQADEQELQARMGDSVKISYTAALADGTILESSTMQGIAGVMGKGKKIPDRIIQEEFCLGTNKVLKQVQDAVVGMTLGSVVTVKLPPGVTFGHKNENLMYTVTKDMVGLPLDMPVPLNTVYKINGGKEARVVEEDGKYLVLDANPELSGEELVLHISLQDILGENCNVGVAECMFEYDQ